MTVDEWLALLNRKVFFWPTEARVEQLLAAKAYRSSAHLVLLIQTESLVARYGSNITLAPINTGAVLYDPPARGRDTLLPISAYPYDDWRRRRGSRTAIAEVAVDYAVPDVRDHVTCVQRRQYGRPSEILFSA
jgi:hypothetical protein